MSQKGKTAREWLDEAMVDAVNRYDQDRRDQIKILRAKNEVLEKKVQELENRSTDTRYCNDGMLESVKRYETRIANLKEALCNEQKALNAKEAELKKVKQLHASQQLFTPEHSPHNLKRSPGNIDLEDDKVMSQDRIQSLCDILAKLRGFSFDDFRREQRIRTMIHEATESDTEMAEDSLIVPGLVEIEESLRVGSYGDVKDLERDFKALLDKIVFDPNCSLDKEKAALEVYYGFRSMLKEVSIQSHSGMTPDAKRKRKVLFKT